MGKRSPPHNTYKRANAIVTPSTSHRSKVPCAQHTHGGNERDASNSTALRFTSPFPGGLSSHTHSEARRTPSAPLQVHSAGRRPVTPVPSQWGNTNNRRRGPSVPLAEKKRKKETRACQKHSQQRDTQRDTETHSDSRCGNYRNKPQGLKRKKKR
ncbi:hypothetical protein TcCL_Unassigned00041 [Trypanosoma cruzi]|nr:hypothetical protein TcCL_Unassigned00041 [Trypanosoma cruzi]